jgi:hypothetical protein
VHEPGVGGEQRLVVDAEAGGRPRRPALDDDVGPAGEGEEALAVVVGGEVEHGPALAAVPHPAAGERLERVAGRPLDPGDPRALVGQQHARHRTGDAPREVEDLDALQDPLATRSGHSRSPRSSAP